jgi:hypothetical protein
VLHAQKLAESAHFTHYVEGLDILRAEKVSFLAGFPPWDVLGHAADALLAHHWHSPHSHRHYEALHGGFPLVHNSPWLGAAAMPMPISTLRRAARAAARAGRA